MLLVGDTVFPNPDRRTVAFLRSYPNRIPLSAAVVQRMAGTLAGLRFDRIYGLLDNVIDADGAAAIRFSADRHAAWVRGDHDAHVIGAEWPRVAGRQHCDGRCHTRRVNRVRPLAAVDCDWEERTG